MTFTHYVALNVITILQYSSSVVNVALVRNNKNHHAEFERKVATFYKYLQSLDLICKNCVGSKFTMCFDRKPA